MPRKTQKLCEACKRSDGARFRTLVSLYLCAECFEQWNETGEIPEAEMDMDVEPASGRW